jgi:acetyl-CoA acyltransferase
MTGEQMGEAAEKMAKLNGIPRDEQDRIALASHKNAARAWSDGTYAAEVMHVLPPPYEKAVIKDNLVREDTTLEALAKLPPVFDKRHGSITAGNASPLTDGASALLLMRASKAKALGYTPLGYVRSWAYAAVDPGWQLLMAPVLAVPVALARAKVTLRDMDLVDMHEAFAAQVASNLRALASPKFYEQHAGTMEAPGDVDPAILNVNGGSIALGHPFAATGGRMVLSTLRELKRRDKKLGLLTICAAGGLGVAVVLEAA